jgi:hypothetical protein
MGAFAPNIRIPDSRKALSPWVTKIYVINLSILLVCLFSQFAYCKFNNFLICCFDNLITLRQIEKPIQMHFISQELEDYIEQHSEKTSIISRFK